MELVMGLWAIWIGDLTDFLMVVLIVLMDFVYLYTVLFRSEFTGPSFVYCHFQFYTVCCDLHAPILSDRSITTIKHSSL